MIRKLWPIASLVMALSSAVPAKAVSSAELYQSASYTYGRFEARIRFASGDGVVSSFFLWKPGSEMPGTFWNELDFEKLGADCRMQTNPLYGLPVADHGRVESVSGDLCGEYHTYAFEWAPTYIAWLIDDVEVRREEGEVAAAYELNAASGMQIHFNVWPGDATFGGNFDPAILPVRQYISWVQYSSLEGGTFVVQWREDFTGDTLPSGWALGNWASPKNYSTHVPGNVSFASGTAVLSLTADDATGFTGEPPPDESPAGTGGSSPSNGVPGGTTEPGGNAAGGGSGGASAGATGAPSGAGGRAPVDGGATGPLAPAGETSGSRSEGGCSVGTRQGHGAPPSLGFALVGLFLASRLRRRQLEANAAT